ncbi:MAG TPA: hypothetical protein VNX87_08640 [Candidatus Sulfotelmatobacter sp.]|jgi:hypothetical protein|nr:hypothetical protein [Candidatus Sulfotelmatobacter sp.]
MSTAEVFRKLTSALNGAGIAYMLTGSFASAHYGTSRSTQDIDIVIDATVAQLRRFAQILERDDYYVDLDAALDAHRQESMFNVIDRGTGWKIDLIFRKSRPFSKEEFRRRQAVTLQGLPIFIASAEDVIVAKLEWTKLGGSQRQIEDAAAIVRARGKELDQSYLEKWIAELGLTKQWILARQTAGMID